MSALGSSVINKSSRRLAPRAPPPRRRPTASSQTALPTPPVSQTQPENTSSSVTSPPPDLAQLQPRDTQATTTLPRIDNSSHVQETTEPIRKRQRNETHQNSRRLRSQDLDDPSSNLLEVLRDQDVLPQTSAGTTTKQTRQSKTVNNAALATTVSLNITEHIPSRQTRQRRLSSRQLANTPSQPPQQHQGNNPLVTAQEPPNHTATLPQSIRKSQRSQNQQEQSSAASKTRSSARTQTSDQASAQAQEDAATHPVPVQPAKRRHRKDSSAAAAQNTRPSIAEDSFSDPQEQPQISDADHVNAEESGTPSQQPQDPQDNPPKKQRKRRATPEGAAEHKIDTQNTLMFDLTKDSKKGQKSKLEAEFQEVDWAQVLRLRREAEARAREGILAAPVVVEADRALPPANQEPQGPRLKLVNGQIVVDNSSLTIDRHAGAVPDESQPAVEERDITRRITSRTWMFDSRRDPEERILATNKADPWSVEATEKFYSALRMWGTDFFMISKMFPGRTRRHIKLKFVREERANAARVKEALVGGSVPMDLEAYCAATGKSLDEYKDPEALQEELRLEEEQQRAEIERQKEEQALAQRTKQEAATAKAAASKARKAAAAKSGSAGAARKKTSRSNVDIQDSTDIVESVES